MKTFVPEYYRSFSCIAGRCRHSCCIGWEIDIDPQTLDYYKTVPAPFGKRLWDNIEQGSFRLGDGERCPFLNGENLCDIFIHLGEEHLCQICTDHPRYRNEVGGRVELGLGLCCEAAAELILGWREAAAWTLFKEDEQASSAEDPRWEETLFTRREEIVALLQDRNIPLDERIARLLEQELDGADPWFYRAPAEWAEIYGELERLDPAWDHRLARLSADFPEKRVETPPETAFEQLLVYFINRHLTSAEDEWDFIARLSFALLSTAVIRKITLAEGGTFEELCDIARQYSSEIEYSEDNTAALLEELL